MIATLAFYAFSAVLLASAFATQNKRGSFITLEKKERKQLFSTLLGLDAFQAMSDTARQAAALVDQAKGRLNAVGAELQRATSPEIVADLDRRAHDLQTTGGDAEVRQRDLRASISQLEARLVTVQDQVTAYTAATQRVKALEAELATRRSERARIDVDRAAADATSGRELAQFLAERDASRQGLANRIAKNETIQEQAAGIRAAVAAIATIDQQLADLTTKADTLRAEGDAARDQVTAAERARDQILTTEQELQRVKAAAGFLDGVPCGGAGDFAACRFLKDATTSKARIPALEAAIAGKDAAIALVATRTVTWQASKPAFEAAVEKIRQLRAARRGHETLATYSDALAAADARIAELEQQRTTAEDTYERGTRAAHDRHADAIGNLTDRADALDSLLGDLGDKRTAAEADVQLNTEANAEAILVKRDVTAAQTDWDAVTRTLAQVETGRQDLDRRRAEVLGKRARLDALDFTINHLTSDLLDWQTLAKALGRDGLPVLEIDATGPTISSYTNRLLEECFGPRFSVDLVTQRAKADGKGFTDDFTIKVFDNLRGGDARDIAELSGGEQAILNEALMNGIGLYVNSRSAMPIRTAWRDETTGALDPENAVRYVQMLRKVLQLGGYHQILFISHNPDAAALADAQLHVHDGRVDVVLPPFGQHQEAA